MKSLPLFLSLLLSAPLLGQVKSYEGYPLGVHIVAFSPDGKTLLMGSGASESTMHLFDIEKEVRVGTIGHQPDGIAFAGWFPKSGKFYTSGKDSLKIWSDTESYELFDFGSCPYEGELIFHENEEAYAIACGKKVYVLDEHMVKQFEVGLDEIYSAGSISPNGQELVIATALDELMFINLNDGSLEKTITESLAKQVVYLSDYELMAVDYYIFKEDEPYIRFINRGTGVETNFTDSDKVLLAKKVPGKDIIVTTHSGGFAKLYTTKGVLIKDFGKIGNFPLSMDISKSGDKAAIGLLNKLAIIDLSDY